MKKYLSYDDLKRTRPCDEFLEDFRELFNDEMEVNRENIDELRRRRPGGGFNRVGWPMGGTFEAILNQQDPMLAKKYNERRTKGGNYIDIFIDLYSGKMSLVDKIVKAALK
jgi:hypothetical protein